MPEYKIPIYFSNNVPLIQCIIILKWHQLLSRPKDSFTLVVNYTIAKIELRILGYYSSLLYLLLPRYSRPSALETNNFLVAQTRKQFRTWPFPFMIIFKLLMLTNHKDCFVVYRMLYHSFLVFFLVYLMLYLTGGFSLLLLGYALYLYFYPVNLLSLLIWNVIWE